MRLIKSSIVILLFLLGFFLLPNYNKVYSTTVCTGLLTQPNCPGGCPSGYDCKNSGMTSQCCTTSDSGGGGGGGCTPSCPSGYCGPDGCGGTCSCQSGQTCSDNSCQDILSCDASCDITESTYGTCGAGSCLSTQRRVGIVKRYKKNLHTGSCTNDYCRIVKDVCQNDCACGADIDADGNACCAYSKFSKVSNFLSTQVAGDDESNSDRTVELSWNAITSPKTPDNYEIQIAPYGTSDWGSLSDAGSGTCGSGTVGASTTSCTDIVEPQKSYVYRIRAKGDSNDCPPASDWVTVSYFPLLCDSMVVTVPSDPGGSQMYFGEDADVTSTILNGIANFQFNYYAESDDSSYPNAGHFTPNPINNVSDRSVDNVYTAPDEAPPRQVRLWFNVTDSNGAKVWSESRQNIPDSCRAKDSVGNDLPIDIVYKLDDFLVVDQGNITILSNYTADSMRYEDSGDNKDVVFRNIDLETGLAHGSGSGSLIVYGSTSIGTGLLKEDSNTSNVYHLSDSYSEKSYNNSKGTDIDALFSSENLVNSDGVMFVDGDLTIDNTTVIDKPIIMITGSTTITREVENINALIISKGDINVESYGTDNFDKDLRVTGGLLTDGNLVNARKNPIYVNNTLEYLSNPLIVNTSIFKLYITQYD